MPINDVLLSEEQRVELSSIAQSRSLPAGYVFRARLILMLAAGVRDAAEVWNRPRELAHGCEGSVSDGFLRAINEEALMRISF